MRGSHLKGTDEGERLAGTAYRMLAAHKARQSPGTDVTTQSQDL